MTMPIHRIRDEASHREALREIERLWNAAPGTEERETVGVLAEGTWDRARLLLARVGGDEPPTRADDRHDRQDQPSLAHPGCSPGEALPARLRPKAQALPRTHASRAPGPGLDPVPPPCDPRPAVRAGDGAAGRRAEGRAASRPAPRRART